MMEEMYRKWSEPHYVCCSGFADLPKGTTASEVYKIVAFVMVIDSRTDIIVDAGFSFILDVTSDFIRSLVVGEDALHSLKNIQSKVRTRFLTPVQGAVMQSIRNAFDRYAEWKRQTTVYGEEIG